MHNARKPAGFRALCMHTLLLFIENSCERSPVR